MEGEYFEIESITPFSESLIWKLNRNFYKDKGISAWSDDVVPHHMTSNSKVGKTYAELILAFLKDLAAKGKTEETVYILELGAGHGRLAFHVLQHLQKLETHIGIKLPPYCYILSDIVEDNLNFFQQHSQFQSFYEKGCLDLAYFDAAESQEMHLRHADLRIQPNDLTQPLLVLANYFFDSIPNDLFLIQNNEISNSSISIQSKEDPTNMSAESLIKNMELNYHHSQVQKPIYEDPFLNEILDAYKSTLNNTYLFFPEKGIQCLMNLKNFSSEGLLLLSMDKGFHEIHDLEKRGMPDLVTHGSFSLWVNFHAFGAYCNKYLGKALFPSFSTFHLDIACLMFLSDPNDYKHTLAAHQTFVDDFGPDDFNSIKNLTYFNVSRMTTKDLIALFRLSLYDSTFFIKLIPRLKQVSKSVTVNERRRLEQTFHKVWEMYFNINESYDLAYELAGLFYDLGFYENALTYFQYSTDIFGAKADVWYNKISCYYQLRQDQLFISTLKEAEKMFPNETIFKQFHNFDMTAL